MGVLAERDAWFAEMQPGGTRELFEHLGSTLFFAKNRELQLMAANQAFAQRCGYADEAHMIGHRDEEIFPPELAEKYRTDDLKVLESGEKLLGIIELFPNQLGEPEWFITDKVPLFSIEGEVIGLCGTVRSYEGARSDLEPYLELLPVVEHLKDHFREKHSVDSLATLAGVSVRQLERQFQKAFRISPSGYILKLRVLAACDLLVGSQLPITQIALEVGFYDHSAFSRKFSVIMGRSPSDHRKKFRPRRNRE